MIGGYLFDRPRDVLYELATSANPWERRTAITATAFFIRKGQVDETFVLGELLVDDEHHFVQTVVGSWLREAGKQDRNRLVAFLDRHAATMPRSAARFAIEKLEPNVRKTYLAAGTGKARPLARDWSATHLYTNGPRDKCKAIAYAHDARTLKSRVINAEKIMLTNITVVPSLGSW